MKFFLIGDKETALGFSLAGIETVAVESQTEALESLRQAWPRLDIKIILITEKVAEQVRPFLDTMLLRKGGPLILEIPDRHGPWPGRQSLEDVVLAALGIKM